MQNLSFVLFLNFEPEIPDNYKDKDQFGGNLLRINILIIFIFSMFVSCLSKEEVDDGGLKERKGESVRTIREDSEEVLVLVGQGGSCSVAEVSNVVVTRNCECLNDTCTVGVTPVDNYSGSASLTYVIGSSKYVVPIVVTAENDAPVAEAMTLADFDEDTEEIVTLTYTDEEGDQAHSCFIFNVQGVEQTTDCSCTAGVCTVGVTGVTDYSGGGSFEYIVQEGSRSSNAALVSFFILGVNDDPVTIDYSGTAFLEDTESMQQISYQDGDNDLAQSCLVFNESNVSVSTACSCDSSGECSFGVTGNANYYGVASVDYIVTTEGRNSNVSTIQFAIGAVDDAPTGEFIANVNLTEDIPFTLPLGYTDVEGDQASSCSLNDLNNIVISSPCSCINGSCSVGIRGTTNFNGTGSFDYIVRTNGLASEEMNVAVEVVPVDDAPVAHNFSPSNLREDVGSTIQLSFEDAESDEVTDCAITSLENVTISTPCACTLGTCEVGVTGVQDYNGLASFEFTVTANQQTSLPGKAYLEIAPEDDPHVTSDFTAPDISENIQSEITLSYSDVEGDIARACTVQNLVNVTTYGNDCFCDNDGVCTAYIVGTTNYTGVASFDFRVSDGVSFSNFSRVSLTIRAPNNAPVATNPGALAVNEDTELVQNLPYTDSDGDLAEYCRVENLNNLSISTACTCAAGSCSVGIQGAENYNGPASFDFTVIANAQESNTVSVSLTVNSVDDAPIVDPLTITEIEEDIEEIVQLNYSDIDGDLASSCSVSNLSNLIESTACSCSAGVCTVGIQSTSNYYGSSASLDYAVTANGQASAVESTVINVTPVDDAPVAQNFNEDGLAENLEKIITLPYSDSDGDSATRCSLSNFVNVNQTQQCSCESGLCTVGITSDTDFSGAGSFDFIITTNDLSSNIATASLTVLAVNDPPVTSAMSLTLQEDVGEVITLDYTDPDGDLASECSVSNAADITFTSSCECNTGVCTISVDAAANYFGSASFDFNVIANGQTSNTSIINLDIQSVDDLPVTANITSPSIGENTNATIFLGYSDVDGDIATSCGIQNENNIIESTACSCDSNGLCRVGVRGTTNYIGPASFDYFVITNSNQSNVSSVSVEVVNLSEPPVADDMSVPGAAEDVEEIVTLSYTDPDSDPAEFCELENLDKVEISTACSCTGGVCTVGVTGIENFFGPASFEFNVTAKSQKSENAEVNLVINSVEDSPVAESFTADSVNEDTTALVNLVYSDGDADIATSCSVSNLIGLTEAIVCGCSSGVCTVGIRGTQDFSGQASFNYTVRSNGLDSNSALVDITINPINDQPVVSNITPESFSQDTDYEINLPYIDVDGDLASACTLSSLNNVQVTAPCTCENGECSVVVRGSAGYFGPASFNFQVAANSQLSNIATANLTVTVINTPPNADDITPANFDEDVESTITLSYSDIDSDQATSCNILTTTGVTESTPCSCSAGICTVGITGEQDVNGAVAFTYNVRANSQLSNEAQATFSLNAIDDTAVAQNITPRSFSENVESIIELSYIDVDNDLATSCSVSSLSNITESTLCSCSAGVCTVGVTGTLNYTGAASFDFTVTTNAVASSVASATLEITELNAAPTTSDFTASSFNEDEESIITLPYTDTDGDEASFCEIENLSNVSVTTSCVCSSGACSVGVTGLVNYSGVASFEYLVIANSQESNQSLVTLDIVSVNDRPVAEHLTPDSVSENTESIITLEYTDPDGDLAISCAISEETNINVTTPCSCSVGNCTVGVTGTLNYVGAASFEYTVTANTLVSEPKSVNYNITVLNAAPVVANFSPDSASENTEVLIAIPYSDADADLASSCTVSNLQNISETQACACSNGECVVGMTGDVSYTGPASFDFSVIANSQVSNTATASYELTVINTAPVAANMSPASFDEDVESTITLAYTDIDGELGTKCEVLNLVNVIEARACSCTAGTCTVGIIGESNYNGAASFDFNVTANSQLSNNATATLTIDAVNDLPVSQNISPTPFDEDTAKVVTLSYSDADGEQATSCATSGLTDVTISTGCSCVAGVCTVEVLGAQDFSGSASFNYTVTTGADLSNSAVVSLTLLPVDDIAITSDIVPPSFSENTESFIDLVYSDVDGDTAASCSVSNLSNVFVSTPCGCIAGECSVGITGDTDYVGSASFDYTVLTGGETSTSSTATLSVTVINDPPAVSNFNAADLTEDIPQVINLPYNDLDGDSAEYCTLRNTLNIEIVNECSCAAGVCSVEIVSEENYNGSGRFEYLVTANSQDSNFALVLFGIDPVDDAPTTSPSSPIELVQNTDVTITLPYVDVDGDDATTCSVSSLNNVVEDVVCSCTDGDCRVGILAAQGFVGAASFDYTVTAEGLVSNSTTFNIDIVPAGAPASVTDFVAESISADTEGFVRLSYVDSDGDIGTACEISNPENLTETTPCSCTNGICEVGVTGDSNFIGSAFFDFKVTTNYQDSNIARATVEVTVNNDPPVADDITPASFDEDQETTITLSYTDPEGDIGVSCDISNETNVFVSAQCGCVGGVCTVGITGNHDYNGPASFNYTVRTNSKDSNSALATLTVDPVDDLVYASDMLPDPFPANTEEIITLAYTDIDGDLATSCDVYNVENVAMTTPCSCAAGVCTVGVTGALNYTGPASFEFTVTANLIISTVAKASLLIGEERVITLDGPIDSIQNQADDTSWITSRNTAKVIEVDHATGAKREIASLDVGSGTSLSDPTGIEIDASDEYLYVSDTSAAAIFKIELSTGRRSVVSSSSVGIGPSMGSPYFMVRDGDYLYVADKGEEAIFKVDTRNGHRTVVTSEDIGFGTFLVDPGQLVMGLNNNIFVVDSFLNAIFNIDLTTGNRTIITEGQDDLGPEFDGFFGMAINTIGDTLYVTDLNAEGVFKIDLMGTVAVNRELVSSYRVDDEFGSGIPFIDLAGVKISDDELSLRVVDYSAEAFMNVEIATGNRSYVSYNKVGTGIGMYSGNGVVVTADGNTAYISDRFQGVIFGIDLSTGDRTVISSNSVGTGPSLNGYLGLDLYNSEQSLIIADVDNSLIVEVDIATGNRTVVSSDSVGTGTGFDEPVGVAVSGSTAYITDVELNALVEVDLLTGNRTIVSGQGTGSGSSFIDPVAITLDGSGSAYITDTGDFKILAVDLITGNRTIISSNVVGNGPIFSEATSIVLNAANTKAYITDVELDSVFEVDIATGTRTTIASETLGEGESLLEMTGIFLSNDESGVYVLNSGKRSLIEVELLTGDRAITSR